MQLKYFGFLEMTKMKSGMFASYDWNVSFNINETKENVQHFNPSFGEIFHSFYVGHVRLVQGTENCCRLQHERQRYKGRNYQLNFWFFAWNGSLLNHQKQSTRKDHSQYQY